MSARIAVCFGSLFLFLVAAMPAFSQSHTWTTTTDFSAGFLHHTEALSDELRIDGTPGGSILPYLWVPCTKRNTVVRIATGTTDPMTGRTGVQVGQILGEYYSAPEGCRNTGTGIFGPSRTAFDFDGDIWIGNRHDVNNSGHVVKLEIRDRHYFIRGFGVMLRRCRGSLA